MLGDFTATVPVSLPSGCFMDFPSIPVIFFLAWFPKKIKLILLYCTCMLVQPYICVFSY